jgi:hypothetical protein
MMTTNNKHAAFQAAAYLDFMLTNSKFLMHSVTAQEGNKGEYVVQVTLSITQEELLQVLPLLEEIAFKHDAHVKAQTVDGKMSIDIHNALDDVSNSVTDEMVRDVDEELVIKHAEFDGNPLPEGAILTGKQMKKRMQERTGIAFHEKPNISDLDMMVAETESVLGSGYQFSDDDGNVTFQSPKAVREEREYNQELLDLGDLEEQEDFSTAKPASIQHAQKQPKIIRRKATSKVDEEEVSAALAKRTPKPVTAAHNMTPRKVSKAELKSLASQFTGDWQDDLEIDTKTGDETDG